MKMLPINQYDLLTGEIDEEAIDYGLGIEIKSPCIGLMNECKKATPICQFNKSACQSQGEIKELK